MCPVYTGERKRVEWMYLYAAGGWRHWYSKEQGRQPEETYYEHLLPLKHYEENQSCDTAVLIK